MGKVGGNAVGDKVVAVEGAQLVIGHAAGVKRPAAQLRHCNHRISSRATAGALRVLPLHQRLQVIASVRIDQRHVSLLNPHGLQLGVGHFVF